MGFPFLDLTLGESGLGLTRDWDLGLSILTSVAIFQEEDINRIQNYEALPLQEVEYDETRI